MWGGGSCVEDVRGVCGVVVVVAEDTRGVRGVMVAGLRK